VKQQMTIRVPVLDIWIPKTRLPEVAKLEEQNGAEYDDVELENHQRTILLYLAYPINCIHRLLMFSKKKPPI